MKTAAVHHGEFHADDVFAVAILKLIYPELRIIRTHNPEEYAKVDARIDVGRKYNHRTKDYDHHQFEFNEKRKNGEPYASAGLIWKHYGESLVKSVEIATYLDQRLFQPIDANYVGVDIYDITIIEPYELSDVISILNPNWPNKTNENYDLGFKEAVEFAKKTLTREIERANSIFSAKEKIRKTIAMEKKKYIVLEEESPWEETVVNESDLLFVVEPHGIEGTWWTLAVPKKLGGFENRKNFPKAWAGLVNEDLAKVTGVRNAIFCHKALFVVVAKSKEGAINLVEPTLRN